MSKIIPLILLIALISSCHKDKTSDLPKSKGVYIINEGNFGFGNADVSFYNPETKAVTNDLFKTANGYSLGDVAQSMYIKDSVAFIVVNNSAKIEMVKIPSFQKIRTITISGSSPRYILPVDDSMAYVTELYSNKIHVINYLTGNLKTDISVPQYTEHLVRVDEYVFAEGKKIYSSPSSKGAVYRIRIADNTFVDRKEFAGDAGGIVQDKNKNIWIALDEDSTTSTKASLVCLDKDLNTLAQYSMNSFGFHPNHLCMDGNGETLFFLAGKNIYTTSISNLQPTILFTSNASNVYSIDVDPVSGDIYLSDALDYVQSSHIYRHDKTGTLIHSFTAGVISGNFAFTHE